MRERERRLYELIEPTVLALGFELVGVQWRDVNSRAWSGSTSTAKRE